MVGIVWRGRGKCSYCQFVPADTQEAVKWMDFFFSLADQWAFPQFSCGTWPHSVLLNISAWRYVMPWRLLHCSFSLFIPFFILILICHTSRSVKSYGKVRDVKRLETKAPFIHATPFTTTPKLFWHYSKTLYVRSQTSLATQFILSGRRSELNAFFCICSRTKNIWESKLLLYSMYIFTGNNTIKFQLCWQIYFSKLAQEIFLSQNAASEMFLQYFTLEVLIWIHFKIKAITSHEFVDHNDRVSKSPWGGRRRLSFADKHTGRVSINESFKHYLRVQMRKDNK